MDHRTYGTKYNAELDGKDIAAAVRADIKAAIHAGALPVGLKVSVRSGYSTHSTAIRVEVTAVPAGLRIRDRQYAANGATHEERLSRPKCWLTREAYAVESTLESMLAAYNYDGSDSMTDYFDVNFYGDVGWSSSLAKAEEEDDRLEALEAAERAEVELDNAVLDGLEGLASLGAVFAGVR